MTELELILIRHGLTDWNEGGIFRGHEDVRLNALGVAQADATAEALKNRVFEAIYSSPLKRSFVTARRIALPHEIDVRVKEEFVDVNYGAWQGLKESTVQQKYAATYDKWLKTPAKVRFPGGENMKKAWKRVNSALRELLFLHGTGTLVIVTHRIPLKFMTTYLLEKSPDDFYEVKHDPCAISIFKISGRTYTPVLLNDSSHLSKLSLPSPKDF
jgi:probable phosphoglycerate mutase